MPDETTARITITSVLILGLFIGRIQIEAVYKKSKNNLLDDYGTT